MLRYDDDTNGNDAEAPSGSVHCFVEAENAFFASHSSTVRLRSLPRSVRLTMLRAETSTEYAFDGENA